MSRKLYFSIPLGVAVDLPNSKYRTLVMNLFDIINLCLRLYSFLCIFAHSRINLQVCSSTSYADMMAVFCSIYLQC